MSENYQIHKTAPIAFFAYKRPEHTRLALESLTKNHGSEHGELFIFCDGPKLEKDIPAINEVREIVKSKKWCGTVNIIERETNMGLANSIITGVTELCEEFGRVIVLEDDLILSPYFLEYMNSALNFYQEDSHIMQISGYMFPVKLRCAEDTLFLPFITSWGWATWQRAWCYFDPDVKQYKGLASDAEQIYKFNLNESYPYFSMLRKQVNGELDSWAIRWYFSVFIKNGLVLHPKWSLVNNIGFDGSGTHCDKSEYFSHRISKIRCPLTVPATVSVCNDSFQDIQELLFAETESSHIMKSSRPSIVKKILNLFKYKK